MSLLGVILVFQQPVMTRAATIFSNLDSGDSFGTTGSVFGFNGSQLAYSLTVDAADTPFYLDSIDVALRGDPGGTGITVNLATNTTGGLEPDTVLDSASVYLFGTPALKTASFSGTTLVSTPGTYWIWLSCTSGCGTNSTWFDNSIGALSDRTEKVSGTSPWTVSSSVTQGAFRVNGTYVPIPPAMWLFGSGLIGLIAIARGKRNHS
jgi:hypothetical protein